MGFMNFENELELEKYLENEIYEFWTWNWYVNDLTSKWYVMDLTSNYYLSIETHFEPMARNRDSLFLILELQNLEFWFWNCKIWNFDFGILLLEFRCPKLCLQNMTQNSSALVLSLAYQQAHNSMTSSLAITQ
jgi:hypothetical protein